MDVMDVGLSTKQLVSAPDAATCVTVTPTPDVLNWNPLGALSTTVLPKTMSALKRSRRTGPVRAA